MLSVLSEAGTLGEALTLGWLDFIDTYLSDGLAMILCTVSEASHLPGETREFPILSVPTCPHPSLSEMGNSPVKVLR